MFVECLLYLGVVLGAKDTMVSRDDSILFSWSLTSKKDMGHTLQVDKYTKKIINNGKFW